MIRSWGQDRGPQAPLGQDKGLQKVPIATSRVPPAGLRFPRGQEGSRRHFGAASLPSSLGLTGAGQDSLPRLCHPHSPPIPPWGHAPQGAMGWGPGTHGPLLPRRRPRSVSCGAPRTACPCRSTCLRTVRSSHRCERGPPPPGGARPGWPRALGTGGRGCPAPPPHLPGLGDIGGEAQLPPAPCGAQGWDGVAGAGPHLLSRVPSSATPRGSVVQRHCILGFFL